MGLHDFGVHQLQAQSFNKNSRNPMIFTFYFKPTLSFVILCKKKSPYSMERSTAFPL